MSGNKFVLDTHAVLYILNGDETLADFLFKKNCTYQLLQKWNCWVTKILQEEQRITAFINELKVININNEIKITTIELKKKDTLKLPDSIIAATAMYLKLPLVTSDKQFKNIAKLQLVYYER